VQKIHCCSHLLKREEEVALLTVALAGYVTKFPQESTLLLKRGSIAVLLPKRCDTILKEMATTLIHSQSIQLMRKMRPKTAKKGLSFEQST
jgi:hypothetical protein